MFDEWKYVIWSHKSFFMLQHQVYVWRMPKEAYNPECLVPTLKHGGGSMTIWAAVSWYSAGPLITLNSQITASDCVDIVGNQVHLMVQMMFLTMMQFFKITVHPYTQPEVFILGLRSMKMHFNIFSGQHNCQT